MDTHSSAEIQQILYQSLLGWKLSGVTSLPGNVSPLPFVEAQPSEVSRPQVHQQRTSPAILSQPHLETPVMPPRSKPAAAVPQQKNSVTPIVPPIKPPLSTERSLLSRSEREGRLRELAGCVGGCTRCHELATTRTQTVFGVGNPEAKLLFLGEAPGADEDKQGVPFVGRAGQLMNKIIEAMKLKREDLYICNILRCRPPGNRTPSPEEAANCREWLDAQLATVDPDFIVCWGTVAAQNLLNLTDPISKLRGRFFSLGRAKVLCTYHPSYLLRNPAAKKPVWEDMQLLLKEMGLPVPK